LCGGVRPDFFSLSNQIKFQITKKISKLKKSSIWSRFNFKKFNFKMIWIIFIIIHPFTFPNPDVLAIKKTAISNSKFAEFISTVNPIFHIVNLFKRKGFCEIVKSSLFPFKLGVNLMTFC